MILTRLRELLLGSPLPSGEDQSTRLKEWQALAALAPDALASVAYANQELYLGLAVAGAAGLAYSWPLALVIGALVGLLTVSYAQTIHAYPGASVAKSKLGGRFCRPVSRDNPTAAVETAAATFGCVFTQFSAFLW